MFKCSYYFSNCNIGLSPALIPLVSTANPANLNTAIERARLVEAEFNYAPAKDLTEKAHEAEIDDLTKKIEQLSINYATLASALVAQPAQIGRAHV